MLQGLSVNVGFLQRQGWMGESSRFDDIGSYVFLAGLDRFLNAAVHKINDLSKDRFPAGFYPRGRCLLAVRGGATAGAVESASGQLAAAARR